MAGSQERLRRDTVVVIGLVATVGVALAVGLGRGIADGLWAGVIAGLVAGPLAGLVSAFFAGAGAGAEPQSFVRHRPHPIGRLAATRTGLASRLLFGLAADLGNGIVDGLVVGLGLGLAGGLLSGLAAGLVDGLTGGLAAGLATGFTVGLLALLSIGVIAGFTVAVVFGLMAGNGPARDLAVMEVAWTVRGTRVHFIPLLQTALHRQVLRQTGATYQFRHAALQDLLTRRPATARR
jgi:hypothetical protein